MTHVSRVIAFSILFAVPTCSYGAEATSPSSMQGTWELVEWVHEGQTLKPPQVQARISAQNGISMFIANRETRNGWVSIFGYGSYVYDAVSYSYGYDLQTEVVKDGDDVSVSRKTIPIARLVWRQDNGRYILDGDGDWGFVLEGDSMTYFEDGRTLRSYRRVR